MGGRPLQAERLTGRALRFADPDAAPTIRRPTAPIPDEGEIRPPRSPTSLREGGWEPPPLCFRGASGVVRRYNDRAAFIGGRPAHGVQAVHNADASLPLSLEEVAADHVAAVRDLQRHGPYHLVGPSMGALLAYQCPVPTPEAGERIGSVAGPDSRYVCANNPSKPERIVRWPPCFGSLPLPEKKEFLAGEVQRLHAASSTSKSWIATPKPDGMAETREDLGAVAGKSVAPRYDGTLLVFRAREGTRMQVPGTQCRRPSPPHVEVLAAMIDEVPAKGRVAR